ncbi:hypothetical protein Q8A67_006969 [Cirrhinus molitorella]|uniref:Uncharacterized protein n=1 Tax=Cirrhinus molitorella TaxID=172907 RepID=A0AA88TS92_9TELE|nr:hypothetical protein Q8A67_006969 [Cirrhinus molitorella]
MYSGNDNDILMLCNQLSPIMAQFKAPLASGHFLGGISGSGYFIRQSPKGYLFSRELLRSIQLPAASAGLSHPAVHLTATAKVMSPSLPFQD